VSVNLQKYNFLQPTVEYVGHLVVHRELHHLPAKECLKNDLTPKSAEELRELMGIFNYYHDILQCCHLLLTGFGQFSPAQKNSAGFIESIHLNKPSRKTRPKKNCNKKA
jgi:hypothetical protein